MLEWALSFAAGNRASVRGAIVEAAESARELWGRVAAARHGVSVVGPESVGQLPHSVSVEIARHAVCGWRTWDEQALQTRLWEQRWSTNPFSSVSRPSGPAARSRFSVQAEERTGLL